MQAFSVYNVEVIYQDVRVTAHSPTSNAPDYPLGNFRIHQFGDQITKLIAKSRRGNLRPEEVVSLGEYLYLSLFDDTLNIDFRSRLEKYPMRLELDFDENTAAIATLPWEFLRAPETPRFPAIDLVSYPKLLISRRRRLWNAPAPIQLEEQLRVSLVVASPEDLPVEYDSVWKKIQELADNFPQLVAKPMIVLNADLKTIDEVLSTKPHILHLISHGRIRKIKGQYRGELALVHTDKVSPKWISDEKIAKLFERHKPAIVVFQSCESGIQRHVTDLNTRSSFIGVASKTVQAEVPFVIAMQYPISNVAAVTFVEQFYDQLSKLVPIDVAVQEARRSLSLTFESKLIAVSPVLFSRVSDGQLFQSRQGIKQVNLVFSDEIVEHYPYPIAVVCWEFNRATEGTNKFSKLDLLINNSIKYLSVLALAQCRREITVSQDHLRVWLNVLSRPTLMSWVDLLENIAEYFEGALTPSVLGTLLSLYETPLLESSAVAVAQHKLAAMMKKKWKGGCTLREFIKLIAQTREKHWGTSLPSEHLMQDLLGVLQPALQEMWSILKPLTEYSLRFIDRVDYNNGRFFYEMREFKGNYAHPLRVAPYEEISEFASPSFVPRRLYLCQLDGQPLVNLHPFLVSIDLILYYLDYNDNNKDIGYVPCSSGERFSPPSYFRSYLLSLFEQNISNPEAAIEQAEAQLDEIVNNSGLGSEFPNDLSYVFSQLTSVAREAIEMALGEALRIGHFWLGTEFLLMGLSRQEGTAFYNLFKELRVDPGTFRGTLRTLVGVKTDGNWEQINVRNLGAENFSRIITSFDYQSLAYIYTSGKLQNPVVTPRVHAVLEKASQLAGQDNIDHIHLLQAVLSYPQSLANQMLAGLIYESGGDLQKLFTWLKQIGNSEQPLHKEQIPDRSKNKVLPASLLNEIGRDLSLEARMGNIHPIVGRDNLVRELNRLLARREKKNVILIGEPGVGKTSIIESVAYHLEHNRKQGIQQKKIIQLTKDDLMVGVTQRGQLEERLQKLNAEVKIRPDVIIFLDEIDSFFDESGSLDLMNILKPIFTRREWHCIGTITAAEYQKLMDKDQALWRNFETIIVSEPSVDDCIYMLEDLRQRFEDFHGVTITPSGIIASVKLTSQYITQEKLPGKAIQIIDQACAYVRFPSFIPGQDIGNLGQPMFTQVDDNLIRYLLTKELGIPLE